MRRLLERIRCWLGWHESPRSLERNPYKWRCVHCRKPWMEW